ncbi:complement factor H-like isoform X3 [Sinocyclocheilus anshuiensis]|uniref:complement factor H-like isoform X3 n=1 Tax=Sinocyclocheilus anshuiensis TaxID=1608454 RepID=UPI0007B95FBA|nr:PREDICTED: complement factor H-like isoform X3 [Sinocyclocheilus anshuiensis]
MRVPVKLLIFSFWLFFLNCSRCQECHREDIKYENTELAEKASYADGETVRVNCMIGYIGLYRLKCEKGEWKKSIERPCAKKKCSNPGDIPNGNFELAAGTEFVFGATLVYTCKKGYEMASRINQRTCRAQGWDNTVPVCEAVKCPAIRTDRDVTASGNTEEGSYGNVIHFECVSSGKKIDGSSDIHCEETGEWSDVVPTCKDITCTTPVISNGYAVEQMPEYQKDAILKYRCNPGFKPREGNPRCAKFGWTLNPECDEVTCELQSTTYGVEKINPEGKTIFRAGQSVEITCSKNYWFSFTKETSKTFTCQYNGEWDDRRTVCQEIRCEVPHDRYLSRPYSYLRGDMKLGAKRSYSCKFGYRETAKEATCTRDGWTPKPLCAEIMCEAPNIPNAEIVEGQRPNYRIKSRIEYKCSPGFEPEQHVPITCDFQGQWTNIQQCTEIMCEAPNIPNAEIVGKQGSHYRINSTIEYKCSTGFEPEKPVKITCDSQRQWTDIQTCTEKMCAAPYIPNAEIVGKQGSNYKINSTIEYKCSTGFEPEQPVQITCDSQRQWTDIQTCTAMCAAPYIPNAEIVEGQRPNYRINSTIEYKCSPGFEPEQPVQITCDSQRQWTDMQTCTAMCAAPYIPNAEIVEGQRPNYRINSTIEYKCSPGFEPEQPVQITCDSQRQWTDIQTCTAMCAAPYIPNAEIVEGQRPNYRINSTIEYKCSPGFEPEQPVQITCDSKRQWTDIQTCTVQKPT